MRRELFAAPLALAAIVSCTPERPYSASFTFTASPLPPVPGKPVLYSFDASRVGLVEIYQGEELVGTIVNPSETFDPFYIFPAKSALTPRAIAYGVNGARIEVEATRGTARPPAVDAGSSDATAPTPAEPTESCGNTVDVTPDLDAGTGCATFGGLLVNVRIYNQRATDVWVYRDQWSPPTPPCTFQPAGVVQPGKSLDLPTFDHGVLRFVDSATSQALRHVVVVQAPTCQFVVK